MATVLEELTGDDTLSPDHVRRRLDDWEHRIRGLYRTIENWTADLPNIHTKIIESAVRLLEEPMRESHIEARRLPELSIYEDGEPRARLEPRGLWIIGANGRLDLTVGLVTDRSAGSGSCWALIIGYYQIRNQIAHGRLRPETIDMAAVVEHFYKIQSEIQQ